MTENAEGNNQFDDLLSLYKAARPKYEAFVDNIGSLLSSLLRSKGIEHLPLERRTKTIESVQAKLARPEKEEKYRVLSDMTDLAGIRIVAYYEKDVDRICEMVLMNFAVDETNSSDKTGTIDPDRFGYLSKHFVVSHGTQRRELPENIQFADLKAEIQVRTVVQHAWAVIDRRLRYNNEADIPRELRRKLFRISALLELADKEFSEVDTAIGHLRHQYEKDVRSGDLKIEINKDSLEIFLAESKTVAQLREFAQAHGLRVVEMEAGITHLLRTIIASGLESIEAIDTVLRSRADLHQRLIKYVELRQKQGAGTSASKAFLIRVCLLLSLPKAKADSVLAAVPFNNPRTALIDIL